MSDEKTINIQELTDEQLEKLSDSQVAFIQDMALRRQNPKLHKRVRDALKDKEKEVFQALCSRPFFYMSPEIEIVPGFTVKLRTLYSLQQDDALEASTEFIVKGRSKGGNSDMVNTVHMSKCFLAHSMETLNGQPFGGSVLQPGVFDMALVDPVGASKVLLDLRTQRMNAIAMIPQPVLQMLIEANQIFQSVIDGITRLGGPSTVEADAERIVAAVGNSTGPQVAGQKPT